MEGKSCIKAFFARLLAHCTKISVVSPFLTEIFYHRQKVASALQNAFETVSFFKPKKVRFLGKETQFFQNKIGKKGKFAVEFE